MNQIETANPGYGEGRVDILLTRICNLENKVAKLEEKINKDNTDK